MTTRAAIRLKENHFHANDFFFIALAIQAAVHSKILKAV